MYKEKLKKQDYLEMYRWLYLIWRTEEAMMEINFHTPICELPHASIGQEAISVGSAMACGKKTSLFPPCGPEAAF